MLPPWLEPRQQQQQQQQQPAVEDGNGVLCIRCRIFRVLCTPCAACMQRVSQYSGMRQAQALKIGYSQGADSAKGWAPAS